MPDNQTLPKIQVSLVQSDIIWGNRDENLKRFSEKIISLSGKSQVVILPELFAIGFNMNMALAEKMEGATVTWMRKMAAECSFHLVGSLFIEENGSFFNRLVWMKPDGSFEKYDKRHLFTLANEHSCLQSGHDKLVAEFIGWKICPMICYDLRFPVWIRNKEMYDVLIFIANWPHTRQSAWEQLLKARAIENQCYCIGVNRVGADDNGFKYIGGSQVIDPMGENIGDVIGDREGVMTVELLKEQIHETRSKFPFLMDADDFKIL